MKRRTLLKTSVAASAVAVAGSVIPGRVMAAYPKAAFESKDPSVSLDNIYGMSSYSESGDIQIKAPEIAENGAVVPIQVDSSLANTESITIIISENPTPIAASFNLYGAEGYVSTRVKMGKSSEVLAVVKAGGSLYAARQEVKVTVGGCGG
jgi:sulfur-oxidizing protein SoxY